MRYYPTDFIGFSLHLTQAVQSLFEIYHSLNNTGEKHVKYAHLRVAYDRIEHSVHLPSGAWGG